MAALTPQTDPMSPDYLGIYLQKYVTDAERKRRWKKRANKIFLYSPNIYDNDKKCHQVLNQLVKVQNHTLEDIEFNSLRIISHFKEFYGDRKSTRLNSSH